MRKKVIWIALFGILFNSCVSHKKLIILQETKTINENPAEKNRYSVHKYVLKVGDLVDVQVSSVDAKSVSIFNKDLGQKNIQGMDASFYINGYLIDENGNINFPIIGEVEAAGITVDSLNTVLKNRLEDYYKYFIVSVKLVNFRISVLGEVVNPGQQYIYNSDINILQAIANAGGITKFGNRRKIKVVRKDEKIDQAHEIDLYDSDVTNNKYYYLLPDDVIYIEPYRAKAITTNSPQISLVFSTISLLIIITNFLRN